METERQQDQRNAEQMQFERLGAAKGVKFLGFCNGRPVWGNDYFNYYPPLPLRIRPLRVNTNE